MGIYDAVPGSITIEPNNSFTNLRGPGLVIPEQLDLRQFRPISLTSTNVQAGDDVAVTFKLSPYSSPPNLCELGTTYTSSLSVNDVEIARKETDVMNGETAVVTLEGTSISSGVVKLTIKAIWITIGPNICSATIDNNLLLYVPYITYVDPSSGTLSLSAVFDYNPNPTHPELIPFKLINYDFVNFPCTASTLSTNLSIHIPDVLLPDGVTHLWVDLEYSPTLSIDGNFYWVVSNYGVSN